MLTIRTNHHWRPLVYRVDVPEPVLRTDLDWTTEDDVDGYLHYRGVWYHMSQFMSLAHTGPIPEPWQGYHGDSFYSGILLRLSDDGEMAQLATYFS